jgi:hypothetical protein
MGPVPFSRPAETGYARAKLAWVERLAPGLLGGPAVELEFIINYDIKRRLGQDAEEGHDA